MPRRRLNPVAGINPANHRINPGIAMAATRLEVRLSDQVNERTEALAAAEGMTKTDVFRRALALYLLAKKQEQAGARLQFANGDQVETLVNI